MSEEDSSAGIAMRQEDTQASFVASVDDKVVVQYGEGLEEARPTSFDLPGDKASVKYKLKASVNYERLYENEENLEERLLKRTRGIEARFDALVDFIRRGDAVEWNTAKEPIAVSDDAPFSFERLLEVGAAERFEKVKEIIWGDSRKAELGGVSLRYENITYKVPKQKDAPDILSGPSTIRTACLGALIGWFYACKNIKKGPKEELEILHNMSGCFRPGESTLVLGPAGCGKTSLMRVLSGRLHGKGISGTVKYNGSDVGEVAATKFATYVSQLDRHFARLTVKETLEFALDCRGEVGDKALARFKEVYKEGMRDEDAFREIMLRRVDLMLSSLGLSRVAKTVVGDASLRGISGGEKRRLTLGELLVVGAKVLFLDEISTGLDSAATQDIVRYICVLCKAMNHTAVISLLQPPPEVYDLFDNVLFMVGGYVVYHGPRVRAMDYFASLGYTCPGTTQPSEFLQEIVRDEEGRLRYVSETAKRASELPRTNEQLADAFTKSAVYEQLLGEEEVEEKEEGANEEKTSAPSNDRGDTRGTLEVASQKRYNKSFGALLLIVAGRQFKLYLRNKAFVLSRIVQNLVMGILIGLLTFQTPIEDYYVKIMVLYTTLLFVGFGSISLLPQVFLSREIWYKQHSEGFYPPVVYALAEQLIGLPTIVLDSLVLGNLVYWMSGFTASDNGSHYFVFLLVLLLYGLMVSNLMRLCGYALPDATQASGLLLCGILLMVLFSGAIATRETLPVFYTWIYWVNPTTWAYTAVAQNEFFSGTYLGPSATNATTGGCMLVDPPAAVDCAIFFLKSRQFPTENLIWWGVLYLAVWSVILTGLQILVLHKIDYSALVPTPGAAIVKHRQVFKRPGSRRDVAHESESQASSLRKFEETVTPSTLTFKNLGYHVEISTKTKSAAGSEKQGGLRTTDKEKLQPDRLDILKQINGFFLPGEMTALMGSSGAGKSTLMDVLAGRKTTGVVTGEILLNGAEVHAESFARTIGYVEQFGIHLEQSTVRESLLFSAAMRLGKDATSARREALCDVVLDVLELEPIADRLVGNSSTGLSFEEIKRLTIAVELVANPSILFADEPTSGLEAHAALTVMKVLRGLADMGRTVVATVHQPNEEIFQMFDRLLLLKRGGEVVYFDKLGEKSANLLSFFQAIPGVEPCEPSINPATWMLTVIGAGTQSGTLSTDFAGIYRGSQSYVDTIKQIQQLVAADSSQAETVVHADRKEEDALLTREVDEGSSGKHVEPAFATSTSVQVSLLTYRNFLEYYRTPGYSLYRILIVTGLSVVTSLIFVNGKLTDASDVQSVISSINVIITVAGNYNVGTIIPFMYNHKALFYRERASNTYSAQAFAIAANIVEDPFILLQAIFTVVGFYFIAGLILTPTWVFFYFLFMFWLYLMLYTFIGLLISTLLPNVASAQIVATIFTQLSSLFSGISVPGNRIPPYLIWLYYLSPLRWVQEGLLMTQFNFIDQVICNPFGTPVRIGANDTCSGIYNLTDPQAAGDGFYCCPPGTRAQTARDFVLIDFLGGENGYRFEWIGYDFLYIGVAVILVRGIGLWTTSAFSYNQR